MRFIDETGRQYSQLTVVERMANKGRRPAWLCSCSCGNRLIVRGESLRSGHTKSCGCRREIGKGRTEEEKKIARKDIANRFRRNHLEECCKYNCEWIRKHPGQKAIDTAKRKARKLNAEGDGITREQWLQMCSENVGKCSYCGQKKPLTMDHVIPLVSGGKHDISNIVPACKSCNSSKKQYLLTMFLYRRSYGCSTSPSYSD
jgi:5-methylcytosine-specific restriction endonuclease McrA